MKSERVLILGASDKPERYSHKALIMLQQHGHVPVLVSPRHDKIEGLKVYKNILDTENIDTVTVYVNPTVTTSIVNDLIKLKPKRVIFNPGSENPEVEEKLKAESIEVEEACTLVLLSTDQF